MLKVWHRGNLLGKLRYNSSSVKRFFLSDAFKCTEAWENRLKAPIFQKVQLGILYSELDKSFATGRVINVLDVDLFVNGVVDSTYQNEIEDILHKLRSNPETRVTYESTSHAAIRILLSWNKKAELLDILSQRLIYGVFPSVYLSILMVDSFLKENDVVSAVKIAVLEMLQEECNHPILRTLSLYSCIKYLNSPEVWPTPKEEAVDEDEDVVKIRVDYIRNYYYDDHFDIIDTNHLVGKTMFSFGKTIEGPIGISCQLIGLVLHEKFVECKSFVSNLLKNDLPIHKEAVEKAMSYLQNIPKQESDSENAKDGSKAEEKNATESTNEVSSIKSELAKLLGELSNKNLLSDSLETELENYVRSEVVEHENNYIVKQCEIYKKWEEDRMKHCEEEMKEEKKQSVRREIDEIRQQLEAEEKKLFYYDNEEELDEMVEQRKIDIESVEYYKPRRIVKPFPQMGYLPPRARTRKA